MSSSLSNLLRKKTREGNMYAIYVYNNNVHSFIAVKNSLENTIKLYRDENEAIEWAEFFRHNFSSSVFVVKAPSLPERVADSSGLIVIHSIDE